METKRAEARAKRQKMMLEDPMMGVIPRVAIPMIISSMIDSIYNLADTFFVSQLGMNATAAVAINDSLMNILRAIAMGFAMGAASYISRLMGAKLDKKASKVGSTVLILGSLFSLCFGLICLGFRSPIVDLLGATASSKAYSMDYSFWILLAAPFTTANLIMNQLLRSEGSTTYAMIGMSSGCIVNCVLDPIFINGLGLEVGGAALATAISKIFSCCMLAIPFIKGKTIQELSIKNFEPKWDNLAEVVRMGVPTFLRMSLMSTGGIITNNVAGSFGTAVQAGVSVANKIYRLIGSAIMGFSQGFSPVAGYCWGAKRYSRVREAYFSTLKIGGTCAAILGTAMFLGAPTLIGLFNSESDPTVLAIASMKIRFCCIAFVPHVAVMVTSNFYQSLGKPVGNMVLSMSRQLLFLIPTVLFMPRILESLGYNGAYGVALAQGLSDLLAFFILALPLAARLLGQIKPLKDGDPPPFKGKKRRDV